MMSHAIMHSRQVFLSLTIVDDNAMLAHHVLPITSLFFCVLSLYHHWLKVSDLFNLRNVCEIAGAILGLVDALGMAAVPFLYVGAILVKSLAFGLGVRL